jgi:hypothetical protein
MPAPKLADFLSDPKYKEESDFLRGVIDARVKEIAEQYEKDRKKKNKRDDEQNEENTESVGSFFDNLFGGKK